MEPFGPMSHATQAENQKQSGKRQPRDAAGSLELKEGTGPIITMCSCDEFLEVYKEDVTFRIRTPESIDPDRTNPNAPLVAAISDTVGSSSPVVARVLLQGRDILKSALFDSPIDEAAVLRLLHTTKEALVACHKVSDRVVSHVDRIMQDAQTHGLSTDNRGRALNPFPQVPELETDVATYLIHAKRAIQCVCRLPSVFLPVEPKDSNFDHLLTRLLKLGNAPEQVTSFVRNNAPGVRYLIDLRNYQEHPDTRRTIVDNFKVLANGSIAVPMWYVSGETPRPIGAEMSGVVQFLIQMAEAMLIHLVMASVTKNVPFIIVPIDDAKIDRTNPIKYRLSIDMARMKIQPLPETRS